MIEAKDLRIGNLVYSPESIGYDAAGIIEVDSISEEGINAWRDMGASGCGEWQDIDGIPLTPEWLERCGFKFNSNEGYFSYNLPNKPQGIDAIKVGKGVYLHQLQNLYHALTGEELTIKDL